VRGRRALLIAVAGLAAARAAPAQVPGPGGRPLPTRQPLRADTGRARRDSLASDTGLAGRGAGLPSGPSRAFQSPDSVEQDLMGLKGFRLTRYSADSVQFLPLQRQIHLSGASLLEREGSTLQADSVRYEERNCLLTAAGSPQLFDRTGVMVGRGMRYDACNHAGVIARATTDFQEGSATWYLHGDLAVDNEQNRVYGAGSTITSCGLPDPHYHFYARDLKYVTKNIMVARPAVLYVADVPVMWLPFIFQDMRRGRRSGLIPPQFGLSDIVRNAPTYRRHLSNLGYYWVLGDYSDAQVTVDWYSQSFVQLSGRLRYRWLDRFLAGGLAYSEVHQVGGSTSRRISWSHQQDFSLASHLSANIDYASSSQIISRNAVDPVLAVATIDSRVNFQQRFGWGSLSLGGSRTQSLDKPQVVMQLPVIAFTPNPIAISQSVTWSPSFSLSNALQNHVQSNNSSMVIRTGTPGDSSVRLLDTRQTSLSVSTPLRLGRWNWGNSFTVNDQASNLRVTVTVPDPADTSRKLVRTYDRAFQTDVDWSTGINLPVFFQGSWNLQPALNIVNKTGGAFMVRNRFTGGAWVTQGKRLQYAISIAPTFFGLFGGIGPFARFRHSISPSISWSYSPSATVPEAYARAISPNGALTPGATRSLASQTLSFGLSQNIEAKLKPPPRPPGADTAAGAPGASTEEQGRKLRLLSIQTSGLAIDLEKAKQPGHTGWVSGTLSNTFTSDLLQGFSLATAHSLFDGPPDSAGSRFSPYLTSVSARFSLGPSALQFLASLLGLGRPPQPAQPARDTARAAGDTVALPPLPSNAFQRGPLATRSTALQQMAPRGATAQFSASLAFDLSRQRPVPGQVMSPTRSTISGGLAFAPTRHWSVSWQTLYDFTSGKFGSHVLRLDRDLHDWRATFSFVQAPNGNVVFNFNITLIDQPEIKFDYDQRSLPSGP
jgi:hypothetical protein